MWELEAERYDPKPQNFDVQIERQETYLRTKRETFKIKEQKHLEMEMKYISGIHALNLRCSLETCGDWHASGIQWKNLTVRESSDSVFGDYGIEDNSSVPGIQGTTRPPIISERFLTLLPMGLRLRTRHEKRIDLQRKLYA